MADLAAWHSSTDPPLALFPFVRTAGGIAQFLAGMWAYCAVTAGGIAQFCDQASARLLEQIAKQRADLERGRRACRPRPSRAEP